MNGDWTIIGVPDICGACGSDIPDGDGVYVLENPPANAWLPVCNVDCRDSIRHLVGSRIIDSMGDLDE